jgi:hypothetical protein
MSTATIHRETAADIENMLASIRDVVRCLPANRIGEIFDDFDNAVQSKNINFLADTIANWAMGDQGYDRMSVRVNKTLGRTTVDKNDPAVAESWAEFLALQERSGCE